MKLGNRLASPLCLLPLLLAANCVPAPDPSDDNDWRYHGKDAGGTRYSPLAEINRTNVQELEVAWIYRMGEVKRPHRTIPDRMQAPWECTPLAVDGVLYISTPSNRVIALEAETGRELWEFDPQEGSGDGRFYLQHRGVSYWEGTVDGKPQRRILMGTGDARLFALDAETGRLIPGFGEDGWVDLDGGMTTRWPKSIYTVTSPVAVYKNVVVTGSRLSSGQENKGPSGKVRAWDVLTGDLVWEFHTVPRSGEPGNETWEGDSWKDRSGANAWSIISVDTERGWVFVPTASPLGGDRDGQNLYGNTLLVLDALTGKLIWHYQAVRHDTWDYDLPAQPVLVTVEQDGREVPAVAQPTKMGMVFVLDRLTGKPVLPVEERPVPQTGGGYNWPTQPFTVKPPPLVRHNLTRDEVSRVTPSPTNSVRSSSIRSITRASTRPRQEGPTLMLPGSLGGANWSGASFDSHDRVPLRECHRAGERPRRGTPVLAGQQVALPGAPLGDAERGGPEPGRDRLDERPGRGGGADGEGGPADRDSEPGRVHRHRRRAGLRRRHQRPSVPGLRLGLRRGALGGSAGGQRPCHADDLLGREDGPAVRGDRRRWGQRVQRRHVRRVGGLCVAVRRGHPQGVPLRNFAFVYRLGGDVIPDEGQIEEVDDGAREAFLV